MTARLNTDLSLVNTIISLSNHCVESQGQCHAYQNSPWFQVIFLFCFVWFKIYLLILENEQGEGAEGEKESQRDSLVSVEPNQAGLNLRALRLWDYDLKPNYKSQALTRQSHSGAPVFFSFKLTSNLTLLSFCFLFFLLFSVSNWN